MNILLDLEGEKILDACECDVDSPCNYPPCVMERDLLARHYAGLFSSGALTAEGLASGWLELDEDDEPRLIRR